MAVANPSPAKLPLASLSITDDKIAQLRQLLPEVFSEGKVDFEKLKQALGEQVDRGAERYGLNWAGKSEAIRTLQAPGTGTLLPCIDESVNFDTSENLIIEGDNLEVLKLLQKSYYGKVKMIYIDPPYNTGNDFIYNDDFRDSLNNYLRFSGQIDEEGNATTSDQNRSGRFHSNWLNMMYPRLYLARNLLREDGVIFVSIDDNEVHNLRMLMNEVFGEENFVGVFVWKRRASSALAERRISTDHDYVVCYQKLDFISLGIQKGFESYSNPDKDPRGDWTSGDLTVGMNKDLRPNQFYTLVDPKSGKKYAPNPNRVWAYIPESMNKLISEGRIIFPEDTARRPMLKRFKSELKSEFNPVSTWLAETGMNTEATKELQDIFGETPFDYSKPVSLITHFHKTSTKDTDLVLDFFAGSGTTAQAVMELNEADGGNRKYILVQLPEKTDKQEYPTIAHITRERVRRVIQKLQTERENKSKQGDLIDTKENSEQALGFRALRLSNSNFKLWDGNKAGDSAEKLAAQLELHAKNIDTQRSEQDVLFELILKSGLPLSATIEKIKLGKQQGWQVQGDNRALLICLAQPIEQATLDAMREFKTDTLICLDIAFAGNDPLKTNTVLQMRDAGIRFYTV